MAQSNAVLTSSNSSVVTQLAQMTVTMYDMQAQIKKLSSTTTKPTRTNIQYNSWICGKKTLVEVKPSWKRKQATRRKCIVRRNWEETKMGANYG